MSSFGGKKKKGTMMGKLAKSFSSRKKAAAARADEPDGKSTMDEITALVGRLSADEGADRLAAASELRVLALDGDNKVAIVAAHGIGPLVDLCREGADEEAAPAAEAAARALWNLSINNDNKVAIAESGAIGPLARRPSEIALVCRALREDDVAGARGPRTSTPPRRSHERPRRTALARRRREKSRRYRAPR